MTLPELLDLDLLPERFTVYLTRHATPDRSRLDIPYHYPPGPELTERGRSEAAELGAYLSDAGAVHFLASPLVRAWNTAKIASEAAGASVELNTDLAEWRPEELEKEVQERMRRAFLFGAQLSLRHGPVALVSHGSPVLTTLKWLGLPKDIRERCRIYDSRNLIPMGGAWLVQRDNGMLDLRLAHVPTGMKLPDGLPEGSLISRTA
jgi:phosphohistidine phosphatase SixA